jgi:hypothetical protein
MGGAVICDGFVGSFGALLMPAVSGNDVVHEMTDACRSLVKMLRRKGYTDSLPAQFLSTGGGMLGAEQESSRQQRTRAPYRKGLIAIRRTSPDSRHMTGWADYIIHRVPLRFT